MTAVEYLINELSDIIGPIEATLSGELLLAGAIKRAKEMEKEQKIEFAKLHVQTALKAVENEMILQASSVKHWYLPETIK